jgi:SAM-dependent methyltransferase
VSDPPAGWLDLNRQMWDERVPIHTASAFYDVAAFKAGRPALEPFEVEELGALGGCRLAHLQCHFGLDTLDLVRLHPTLTATGLDFSQPAIDAANQLATELELANRANFVQADVREATRTLGAGAFDVVYTGKGAIIWLPDLEEWAAQCAHLLKPGGWLYLCEFHPVGLCLDQTQPTVKYDYFDPNPYFDDSPGTYADLDAPTTHNQSYEWAHPISQVLNYILKAGLRLQFFHEWDYTLYPLASWLTKGDDGRYRWPSTSRLPLMYSLKAQKPALPTDEAP